MSWDGGGDGTDWSDADNWNPAQVPTDADDVTIDIAATVSTTAAISFSTLTIGDNAGVVTSTLRLANDITSGGAVTIRQGGVLTQADTSNKTITGALTINSGGYLTHLDNSTAESYKVVLTATGLTLNSGGYIWMKELGYDGGEGSNPADPGAGTGGGLADSAVGSGGAHAGNGGTSKYDGSDVDAGGTGYGSLSGPTTLGSGGGGAISNDGGNGGGAAKITITGGGTATINGTVQGDAGDGVLSFSRASAGGAGGAFWLDFSSAGTYAGSGTITVDGGQGAGQLGANNTYAGGGGGGYIAVTGYGSSTFSGSHSYLGGGTQTETANDPANDGGGGILFLQDNGGDNGALYIGGNPSGDATGTAIASTTSVEDWYLSASSTAVINTGVTFTVASSTVNALDTTTTSTVDIDGTLSGPSSFTIPDRVSVETGGGGISGISTLVIDDLAAMQLNDVPTTTALSSLTTLTINGTLTHQTNSTSVLNAVNISATNITVGANGLISAVGLGYSGGTADNDGTGPGGGEHDEGAGADDGGGGGYGGEGGCGGPCTGATEGGVTYGSTSTPHHEAGSGGGGSDHTLGGAGGGIIMLTASDTLTINGLVDASGAQGTHVCGGIPSGGAGGGSGGGIYLEGSTIAGSGTVKAEGGKAGGNGSGCSGGGGGGGRMLIVASTYTFSGTTSTSPGDRNASSDGSPGATGTIGFAPSAPTTLYSNNDDASSGQTDPVGLTDITPNFSAIFNDIDGSDTATKARIQVSTDNTMGSITHWDSGSGGTSITSCSQGARCGDITYGSFGAAVTASLALGDDADESADSEYYWRIKYFDSDGNEGAWSATSTFTLVDEPSAPTSPTLGSISTSSVTFSWTDNSSMESQFDVDVSTDGVVFVNDSTPTANEVSTSTTGLTPSTQYTLRVRATNVVGSSSYATSSAFYTLPVVPTTLSASAGDGSVQLSWSANGNGPSTTYDVRNETTSQVISGVTATNYTFSGLTNGSGYTFSVRAVNGNSDNSSYSDSVSATPESGEGPPTGCGACAPPAPEPSDDNPTGAAFLINDGAAQTFLADVEIDVLIEPVHEIALSNDPNFLGSKWQVIDTVVNDNGKIPWTVSSGEGPKVVYAKFTTITGGTTEVYQESINLEVIETPVIYVTTPSENNVVQVNLTQDDLPDYQQLVVEGVGTYADVTTDVILYRLEEITDPITGIKTTVSVPYKGDKDSSTMTVFPAAVTDKDKAWAVTFQGVDAADKYKVDWEVYDDPTGLLMVLGSNHSFTVSAKPKQPKPGALIEFEANNGEKYTTARKIPIFAYAKDFTGFTLSVRGGGNPALFIHELDEPGQPWEGFYELPEDERVYGIIFRPTYDGEPSKEKRYDLVTYDGTPPKKPAAIVTKLETSLKIEGKTDSGAKLVVKKTFIDPNPEEEDDDGDTEAAGIFTIASVVTKTTIADGAGNWSVEFPGVQEGQHQFTTTATDKAGNESDPSNVLITIAELPEEEEEEDGKGFPDEEGEPSDPPAETPETPEKPEDDQKGEVETPTTTPELPVLGSTTTIPITATPIVLPDDTTILGDVINVVGEVLGEALTRTTQAVKAVIDNPIVEQVAEEVVTPAIAATAVVNVAATGAALPALPPYLYLLFNQFIYLFRRKPKGKSWGIAYNAMTKQPVDLATVRLVDAASGRVVQTRVTDSSGRFAFFAPEGQYRIEIQKPGFTFPAPYMAAKSQDGDYDNLYKGETLSVSGVGHYLAPTLPLDPQADSRQPAAIDKERVKKGVQRVISLSGFGFAVAAFIITPSVLAGAAVGFHVVTYLFIRRVYLGKKPPRWGIVADHQKSALGKAVVRLFDAQYNKLLETQVTPSNGRYAFLVGKNTYYVTYEKQGFDKTTTEQIAVAEENGVIANDAQLHPGEAVYEPVEKKAPVEELQTVVPAPAEAPAEESVETEEAETPQESAKEPEFDFERMRDLAVYGRGSDGQGMRQDADATEENPEEPKSENS